MRRYTASEHDPGRMPEKPGCAVMWLRMAMTARVPDGETADTETGVMMTSLGENRELWGPWNWKSDSSEIKEKTEPKRNIP